MPKNKKPEVPTNTQNVMHQHPRGKNAGAQTNGQFERDQRRSGKGQFVGAGDAPRMTK